MKTTVLRLVLLVLAAALTGGCGSTPPTEYYVLSAQAPAGAHRTRPSIGIVELGVAEYLQRPEMVIMQSANQVRLRDYHLWAEPLEEGVQRTLVLNLGALLGTDSVRAPPWPRDWAPDWLLRVNVARLDVSGQAIELVAFWSLTHGTDMRERSSRLSRARSGDSADSVAADTSALLLELSEQIAAEIGGTPAGG